MSQKDYVSKILSQDQDIEAGMLWDMEIKPPKQLHSDIMDTIRRQSRVRKRFNYRTMMSTAAAAVVALVVFIGGSRVVFNNFQIAQHTDPGINSVKTTPVPSGTPKEANGVKDTGDNTLQTPAESPTVAIQPTSGGKLPASSAPAKNDVKSVASADKIPTPAKDKVTPTSGSTLADPAKTPDTGKSVAMGPISGQKDGSDTQAQNQDTDINLEITVDNSTSEVLGFISINGVLIESGEYKVYKLDYSKIESLNNVVISTGAEIRVLNGMLSGENKDLVIRIVIKE